MITALQANRDKLIDYDPRVRRDEWDSVHQMRVATRELRSHLQTFHGIVVGPQIEKIEADLKELASILGVARDAEVVEERWQELLESEDSDTLDAATREHISRDMGTAYRRAHRRVIAALNSEEYLELLESLDRLLADPLLPVLNPQKMPTVMTIPLPWTRLRKRPEMQPIIQPKTPRKHTPQRKNRPLKRRRKSPPTPAMRRPKTSMP